jgi:DNA polymerase-3 subunit delta'
MKFVDIIGHEALKAQLIRSVQEQRVSHAQLFLGPEGNGGLALALAYAQYVNCTNPTDQDSCGVCASCSKYARLIHPDLHFSYPFFAKHKDDTAVDFIQDWRNVFLSNPYLTLDFWKQQLDSENKQANINIAEAHAIIKKLSLKAFEGPYKVLIMWLPEFLDIQGNALLKLIEEPPAQTLFLLVAEQSDKILSTILSRTQLIKVSRPTDEEVTQYLLSKSSIQPKQAAEIALLSQGNLQLASLLLEDEQVGHFDRMIQWLRHCVREAGLALINECEQDFASMSRETQKSFLNYTIQMLRQVVLAKADASQLIHLPDREMDFVQKFAQNYTLVQIEAAVELIEKAHYHVERNANAKLLFLDLSLQLVIIFKFQQIRSMDGLII